MDLCSNSIAEEKHDRESTWIDREDVDLAAKAKLKLMIEERDPQRAYECVEGGESFDAMSELIFECLDAKHVWEPKVVEAVSNFIVTLQREQLERFENE